MRPDGIHRAEPPDRRASDPARPRIEAIDGAGATWYRTDRMADMSDQDRALWALRFGTLAGGALGLDLAFVLAYAVDHLMHADPVWPLRIASAVGMLGGGLGGRRLGAWQDGRLYAALGVAAGLLIAGAMGILMTAVFRAA